MSEKNDDLALHDHEDEEEESNDDSERPDGVGESNNDDDDDDDNNDDDSDADDDDDSDESSELSDSIKYQLINSVDAMKTFIRMNQVRRPQSGPLLDISDCLGETLLHDPRRLELFGQALRENVELEAIDLCIQGLPNPLAKDIAIFFGKSPSLVSLDLNASSRRSNTNSQQQGQAQPNEQQQETTTTAGVDIKMVRLFLHTFLRNPRARDLALWEIVTQQPTPMPDITKLVSTARALKTVKCCDCSINLLKALLQGLILSKTVQHVELEMDWPAPPSATTTNNDDNNNDDATEISRLLTLLVQNCQDLQTLRLDSISAAAWGSLAPNVAAKLNQLRFLEIVLQPVSPTAVVIDQAVLTTNVELLANIVRQTKSLERLDVSGFDWTDHNRSRIMGDALRDNPSATIRNVRLADSASSLSFAELFHETHSLQQVDVTECNLRQVPRDDWRTTIGTHRGLQVLKLSALENEQARGLLAGLEQNKSLQRLHLSIPMAGWNEATIQQWRQTLSNASNLLHLNIKGTSDKDGRPTQRGVLEAIAAVLEKDASFLQSLRLSAICAEPSAVDQLFGALRNNTKLRQLSVTESGLDMAGALRVCEHLPCIRYLMDLQIQIPPEFDTEEHEGEFVRALHANTSLIKLSLLSEDSRLEALAEPYLQRNKTNWMFGHADRKTLWPSILWQYDESAIFLWVKALSDHLTSPNKRKTPH